ncbi:MAG: carboxylating nicotinate-nucleotide diphosphorylase [Candidatus Omnitrophica bacterium]|nr:carboxylating nicotinate-nucleotide diphosphorylase [Candidatus Omnitrophota bacterium]MBU1128930.1 carboxylating nicotinate-nucleotide diphosphorylase [Candidatus Omnitrophota bacterium]MBU1656974.1 carboxylating nicotinate-nucleotide diphosphorylase [Candidatus Omnitrophota bacterium]MBU1785001.1 carboxylating nicotinate-nucleotide diphosphorylase [Candidatus Omnitrophota bacterium]MBU1851915.1 carboxylating nicotinate-nucleotide diphosphorylase [Candidatus Omnitrophota bacterium]
MKRAERIARYALKEDIWTGDITSEAVLDSGLEVDAVIIAREPGIVCGTGVAEKVFAIVDPDLRFRPVVKEGDHIEPDSEIAFVAGNARSMLKAERVALNFLGHMSGIASSTRAFVEVVKGTGTKIFDTRKTMPLHRYMQKYAVTVGGGTNHRWGLWDMVLIKDNHLRAFGMQTKTASNEKIIKNIIRQARETVQKNIRIEIEVETLKECEYALDEKPDVIMLDNMPPEIIKEAVKLRDNMGLKEKVLFEVSGGITFENVKDYAGTGVDIISSGSLTGSVMSLDFSLEIVLKSA